MCIRSEHISSETKHSEEFQRGRTAESAESYLGEIVRVPDMCFSLGFQLRFNCQSEPGSHLREPPGLCAKGDVRQI